MKLKHVAVVCTSEENADRFYADLLGLEKAAPKTIPASLSHAIFGIDSELTIINYALEDLHFEIFIYDGIKEDTDRIEHTCIEVGDLEAFLEKCRALDVEINNIPREGKPLIFISDYDGNKGKVSTKFEVRSTKGKASTRSLF
jgi:catechol 2,3-dioxygenase-like lactoylglutathione lyase family enzyme